MTVIEWLLMLTEQILRQTELLKKTVAAHHRKH
jgi:hypothetical protein